MRSLMATRSGRRPAPSLRKHRAHPRDVLALVLEPRTLFGSSPFPDLALLEDPADPVLRIHTQYGDVDMELLAGRVPQTVANFLAGLDQPGFQQAFFNRVVPGQVVEAGTYIYLGDSNSTIPSQYGVYSGAPGESGGANLARTVSTWANRTPGPPFSQFLGANFSINLQDNPSPAPDGDWVVFARVLGDAAWSVVQTIASLQLVPFAGGYTGPLGDIPVNQPWTPGQQVTPDALVQAWDTLLIKGPGAPDYYRHAIYSAEGFTGSSISEFVPIENPGDQPVYYEVRVRYETSPDYPLSVRDDTVERSSIAPHSRGGLTISTPLTWDVAPVLGGRPYAIEIRSTTPVAAHLSHYDFGRATGEAFTSGLATQWVILDVNKTPFPSTTRDFLLFYNPGNEAAQVELTFLSLDGQVVDRRTVVAERYRRAGVNVLASDLEFRPFTVTITSNVPILATHTQYQSLDGGNTVHAYSALGAMGDPSAIGVVPIALEPGIPPLDARFQTLRFTVYNPSSVEALVDIDVYTPGSTTPAATFPAALAVPPGRTRVFQYDGVPPPPERTLPLSLVFSSTAPVWAASMFSVGYGDYESTQVASTAATQVHFAEGFLDPARAAAGTIAEAFTLFNPNWSRFGAPDQAASVMLTVRFADGGTLVFNELVAPGSLFRFVPSASSEMLDYINQHQQFFYSVQITSDIPVVAAMLHRDSFFSEDRSGSGGMLSGGTIFGPTTRLDHLGG